MESKSQAQETWSKVDKKYDDLLKKYKSMLHASQLSNNALREENKRLNRILIKQGINSN